MRQRQTYYFELANGPEIPLGKTWHPHFADDGYPLSIGSYRNRPGLIPVAAYTSPADLVSELARDRKEGLRWRNGPSQTAVAKKMRVSKAFVARVEAEANKDEPRNPTMKTVRAYAAALGYDVRLVCVPFDKPA